MAFAKGEIPPFEFPPFQLLLFFLEPALPDPPVLHGPRRGPKIFWTASPLRIPSPPSGLVERVVRPAASLYFLTAFIISPPCSSPFCYPLITHIPARMTVLTHSIFPHTRRSRFIPQSHSLLLMPNEGGTTSFLLLPPHAAGTGCCLAPPLFPSIFLFYADTFLATFVPLLLVLCPLGRGFAVAFTAPFSPRHSSQGVSTALVPVIDKIPVKQFRRSFYWAFSFFRRFLARPPRIAFPPFSAGI